MTEMTFDEKVDYNIARLLNESKAGNGLLAKQFASSYDEVRNDTLQNHRLRGNRAVHGANQKQGQPAARERGTVKFFEKLCHGHWKFVFVVTV